MDNQPNLPTAAANVLDGLQQSTLFGPPPLFEGEDAAAYGELLAHVSGAVKPVDFLEQIWVRDVVELTWEILRMRRLRAELLKSDTKAALFSWMKTKQASKILARWAARDPKAIAQVNKRLASSGVTLERVTAAAWVGNIDTFERIDRMVTSAEARRNAALREIERHRTSIAETMRRASDDVLDAEFEDVAPDQGPQKKVA